jgi:release factor glutamine methyltransferase
MTVHDRVIAARQALYLAGIPAEEADLDARLLAQVVLRWDTARFLTDSPAEEPDGFGAAYDSLVRRRVAREPMAYIVGAHEFWSLDFAVSPAVLIPRPETEIIVEAALEILEGTSDVRCVDLCTGSGCLAVSLAHERPSLRIVATDASLPALLVAQQNSRRHGVADRVRLRSIRAGPTRMRRPGRCRSVPG